MVKFNRLFSFIICFYLISCCFVYKTGKAYADQRINNSYQEEEIKRSIESLQDLDYQTWQLIVYQSPKISNNFILRVVGYPGALRMDHPTSLLVSSGRKNWNLKDITKKSKVQIEMQNDSFAEFDLKPLITELDKNRPLRIILPGLINDLPIPPYLVSEWRSLAEAL